MEIIKRRLNGILQDVPIYTESEGDERGLDMAHWKKVKEGQWAITDDGYVTKCFSRKTYHNNGLTNDFIRTTCGGNWSSNKHPFFFEERRANKSYNTHSSLSWTERQAKTKTTKRLVHAVAVMWLSNKPIDYNVLARIYSQRNTLSKAAQVHYVKKILSSIRVKKMIREEIEKELLGQGMTIKTWLELGMELLEKNREKGDLTEMRHLWKDFGDVLQVKEHESRRIPLGEGTKVLEAVSEDLKKIPSNGQ